MFKLIIFTAILAISKAQSPLYEQCGGLNWTGPRSCATGSTCQYQNDYYSQCLPDTQTQTQNEGTNNKAPVGLFGQCGGVNWSGSTVCVDGLVCQYQSVYYSQCVEASGSQTTQSTATSQSTTKPSGTLPPVSTSDFPGKTFKHGIIFDGSMTDEDYKKYDYLSIWINSPWSDQPSKTDFNPYWHGEMVKKCKQHNKLPLFYAYVIAFEARAKFGFQDCDVHPTNNLCHNGANFIRQNKALLVSRYAHQATEIAKALGDKNAACVFVIEPDFWQYYGDSTQSGGPLTGDYMRALFDDFAKQIKAQLPNAKISWDLSAWIREDGLTRWWSFFKSSPYIDFVHTSGGQGQAGSVQYKPNELKWSDFSRITGKRIIADCGYGVGGGTSNNCGAWTLDNKKARMTDGVVALSAAQGAKQTPPNLERLPLP